jgi:ureidoacrylate peracid hydrolase
MMADFNVGAVTDKSKEIHLEMPSQPKDKWIINPSETALVIIDMQNAFVESKSPLSSKEAREFVPRINELAAVCRPLHIPVIFVKGNGRPDGSDNGLSKDFHSGAFEPEMSPQQGKKGAELYAGLDVKPEDYIVPKVRYSAFIPGSSSLEPLLRGLGRSSILICGVATDVCVGATTIDGMMLGFKVFFMSDLTATATIERQKVALELYAGNFAKVMTSSEIINELSQFKGKSQVR